MEQKLRACDIFILLVSRHSLSSDYVVNKEISIIRERQGKGEDIHFYPLLFTPTPKIALTMSRQEPAAARRQPLSDYSINERYRHMSEAADEIANIVMKVEARRSPPISPTENLTVRPCPGPARSIAKSAALRPLAPACGAGRDQWRDREDLRTVGRLKSGCGSKTLGDRGYDRGAVRAKGYAACRQGLAANQRIDGGGVPRDRNSVGPSANIRPAPMSFARLRPPPPTPPATTTTPLPRPRPEPPPARATGSAARRHRLRGRRPRRSPFGPRFVLTRTRFPAAGQAALPDAPLWAKATPKWARDGLANIRNPLTKRRGLGTFGSDGTTIACAASRAARSTNSFSLPSRSRFGTRAKERRTPGSRSIYRRYQYNVRKRNWRRTLARTLVSEQRSSGCRGNCRSCRPATGACSGPLECLDGKAIPRLIECNLQVRCGRKSGRPCFGSR